ncbi:MAG: (d)CMP kinase, partial [Acholeplasmataceae bacterium]
FKEHVKKGSNPKIDQVIEDIVLRDQKDSTRKESPLRKADDAITLDTTHLTIDEVVEKIIELTDKRRNSHGV